MSGLVWSVVILVTILFGTSCVDNAESMLLPSNVKLQSGDIVLRCGSGVTCKVEGGKWMLDLGKLKTLFDMVLFVIMLKNPIFVKRIFQHDLVYIINSPIGGICI